MIFPSDAEIREFTAYSIRARKIIVEEFKQQEGRPPNELELQDLLKMVVVPFGILKQQYRNSHFQTPQIPAQKQAQQPEQKPKTESVMDIVKAHKELAVEGDKIVVKKKIESREEYFRVRDEFKERGWDYVAPKHVGGDKWEPGYFELKEGAKA
jgi:hypothetical protein